MLVGVGQQLLKISF